MQNDEALRGAIHRVGMFARVIDDNGCSMDDERGTELAADLRLVLSALSKVSPTREEVARVIDKLAWTDPGPDDGWEWAPGAQEARQLTALSDADAVLALFSGGEVPEGWRPIETAPKDGTRVLLGHAFPPNGAVWWGYCAVSGERYLKTSTGKAGWTDGHLTPWGERMTSTTATHWQPLPDPPKALPSTREEAGNGD